MKTTLFETIAAATNPTPAIKQVRRLEKKRGIYMGANPVRKEHWIKTELDNKERRRYYGLRIGDIVSPKFSYGHDIGPCEVIEYGFMDNNAVYLKTSEGEKIKWVAEWCTIITKVEDREKEASNA